MYNNCWNRFHIQLFSHMNFSSHRIWTCFSAYYYHQTNTIIKHNDKIWKYTYIPVVQSLIFYHDNNPPNTEPEYFGAISWGFTRMPPEWKPQQPTAAAMQKSAPSNVLVADKTSRKNAGPHRAIVWKTMHGKAKWQIGGGGGGVLETNDSWSKTRLSRSPVT